MKENKKNTGMILLIIVLLVVVMALSGFIVYDKVLTKDAEVYKPDNNNISQKFISVMKFIDAIPESNGLTVEDLKNISYAEKINLVATLSNKKIEGLSEKEIKEGLNKFFGSNLNITTMEDIMCDCGEMLYKYDQSKGMYVYNEEHVDGEERPHDDPDFLYGNRFLESYEIEGNTIKLKFKKIFIVSNDFASIREYYTSYEDAKNNKNVKPVPEEMIGNLNVLYEIYIKEKDNLPVYTYVFEEVDNNYRFVNYTINKNA